LKRIIDTLIYNLCYVNTNFFGVDGFLLQFSLVR